MKIGVFFAGGGIKCCVQVEQAQSLFEYLFNKFNQNGGDLVADGNLVLGGLSAGAIHAATLAQAKNKEELFLHLSELRKGYHYLNKVGPKTLFPINFLKTAAALFGSREWSRQSISSLETIYRILDGTLLGTMPFDPKKVVKSPIKLFVLVTNMDKQIQQAFTNRDKLIANEPNILKDVIAASSALPPLFPSITIEGTRYRDAARCNLGHLIKAGCDMVFVLLPCAQTQEVDTGASSTSWIPYVDSILGYISAVGTGVEDSEFRRVKKEIQMGVKLKEAQELLGKIQASSPEEAEILKRLVSEIKETLGDARLSLLHLIHSPELPSTLRLERFRKEETAPKDVRNKSKQIVVKKGKITYLGDIALALENTEKAMKATIKHIDETLR